MSDMQGNGAIILFKRDRIFEDRYWVCGATELYRGKIHSPNFSILTLPQTAREVLIMRIGGELSFREIGEVLGKSENWARVTFFGQSSS